MFRNFARRRCTTVWPSISHSLGLLYVFSGVHMLLGKFTQDETAVVTRSLLRVSHQSMASKWTDRICYVSVWAGCASAHVSLRIGSGKPLSKPGRFPDMVGSCMPWFGVLTRTSAWRTARLGFSARKSSLDVAKSCVCQDEKENILPVASGKPADDICKASVRVAQWSAALQLGWDVLGNPAVQTEWRQACCAQLPQHVFANEL